MFLSLGDGIVNKKRINFIMDDAITTYRVTIRYDMNNASRIQRDKDVINNNGNSRFIIRVINFPFTQ